MTGPLDILVVDDEESIRLFMEGVLSSEGYDVRTAKNGLDGLEEIKRRSCQILLTDLMMPRMTGLDLMQQAKALDPNIEAILMTAHSTVETAVSALRSGAYDFLTKPIEDIELLLNVVARAGEKVQLRGHNEKLYLELKAKHQELTEKAKELQTTLNALTSLMESSAALSTATNSSGFLEFYVHLLAKKLGVAYASVSIIDKMNGHLEIRRISSKSGGEKCTVTLPSDGSLTSRVITDGKPLILRAEHCDSDSLVAMRHDSLLPETTSSVMIVPIKNNGRLLGLLHLCDRQDEDGFVEADLGMAQAISHQIGSGIENINLRENLEKGYLDTITTLINSLEAKDSVTAGHSERVTHYCVKIAEALGHDSKHVKRIRLAGILHDIGKIGIEERILQKKAKLTTEEYEVIKLHPLIGFSILKPLEFLADLRQWVLEHHEFFAGGGYPSGKPSRNMTEEARIIAVADAYDAMTSDRPYRKGRSHSEAVAELRRCASTQFDPEVVAALVEALGDTTESLMHVESEAGAL